MSNKTSLRTYVLTRFFFFLVIVSAIEFFLIGITNNFIIPSIINITEAGSGVELNGTSGLFSLAFVLLATGITNRLLPIFSVSPVAVNDFLQRRALKNGFNGGDLEDTEVILKYFRDNPKATALLIVIVLIIAGILLLPYLVGGIIFSISVAREIGKRERQKEQERLEEEKRRYLMISNIVHDLKTPMTTVYGYAKALNDGVVPEQKRPEYLQAIMTKSDRMNEVVAMLLDYVKLDSEGFTIMRAKVDVCEMVRSCCAFCYTDIESAGDEIEVNIPEREIFSNLDKIQMTRVVTNLITNAIKHNPSNTTISISVVSESPTTAENLKIIVADSGAEIPEELSMKIFEPFFTRDEARVSNSGTGLGLPLSRRICEMHDFTLKLVQKPEILRYQLGEEYQKAFVVSL